MYRFHINESRVRIGIIGAALCFGNPALADTDVAPANSTTGVGSEIVASAQAASSAAEQVISALCDELLAVLKQSNDADYAARFALFQPILKNSFDLQYMARQAVGRGFLDLDQDKRQLWYDLFAHYMASNYAARFDHYSGQRFEVLGEEPGARDTVLVRTRVIDPDRENVDLGYRLRQTEAGWHVIDVYLKGSVSELALRRSEYSTVLKREGFDALVVKIKEKIDEAATEAGSSSPAS